MKNAGMICLRAVRKLSQEVLRTTNYIIDKNRYGFRAVDIRNRVKRIGGGYRGSEKEYRDTVLAYWGKYKKRPQRHWYALYCDGMDHYDPRFIPDTIWFHDIIPYFNNSLMIPAYADKCLYDRLLPNVQKPKTVIKRMAGYYYDGDGDRLITRQEAERLCEREEQLIFKPSGGSKGSGIHFYNRDETDGMPVSAIFDKLSGSFVAQRLVKQHPALAALNESSLNTVRVLSFHFKGKVHILSALLRIGGKGSRVDNVSAGGCGCAVKKDGWLSGQSVTRQSTWTDVTPSGIKLSSIRIPNYEGIVETIKQLHSSLPYFNIIGWDFAVGEDGTPVFIEFNTKPGQNQISGRAPTFGDLTDDVLEEVFIKKTLKSQ